MTIPLHADPWAQDFVDLDSLNREATDTIVTATEALRHAASQGGPAVERIPFVALGSAGVGKTHLFARLRRRLAQRALLVHTRPLLGSPMTTRFVLSEVFRQLGYESNGVAQIDVLVGTALARATGQNAHFPIALLESLRANPIARAKAFDQAQLQLEGHTNDLDVTYLRRLLAVPFAPPLLRRSWLLWLAGKEVDPTHAAQMGVRDALPEGDLLTALQTLSVLAAPSAPLVLVFDQLENLADAEGTGELVRAYGGLISELVERVKELIIVEMGLSTEWALNIVPKLTLPQKSRVDGPKLRLELPTPEQRRQLLELWAAKLPNRERPFPWPFTVEQLERVCSPDGTTPRMLLLDLGKALRGELTDEPHPPPPTPPTPPTEDALQAAWQERLAAGRADIDEAARSATGPEPELVVDGLLCIASLVEGVGKLRPQKAGLAREAGKPGPSLVAPILAADPRSAVAALRRLEEVAGPVLAFRERWRPWKPSWKATVERWNTLLARPGFRWHWLDREDASRLLALGAFLKDARSGDVALASGKPATLAEVETWARSHLQAATWPISQELLGTATSPAEDEPDQTQAQPAAPAGSDGTATRRLRALRVASLERLVREATKGPNKLPRAAVIAELRGHASVRWIGETVVCWVE